MIPVREFSPWFEDFDGLFEKPFRPAIEVDETDDHFLLTTDLPGVSKEDLKIEVLNDQLLLSGERKTKRNGGTFQRTVTLPFAVEPEKVEASYKDGVLQVAIPKAVTAKAHQVPISEGKEGFFSKILGKKQEQETGSPRAS